MTGHDLDPADLDRVIGEDVPMDQLRVNITRVLGADREALVDQILAEVRDSVWLALIREHAHD